MQVPIPRGQVATTPEEAGEIATRLGGQVAVKAQVLAGGRGKAGGIRLADDPAAAAAIARDLLGREIRGLPVRQLLIEEAITPAQELYLSLILDRNQRRVVCIASSAGGIEIEEVARSAPERLVELALDPLLGLRSYHLAELAKRLNLSGSLSKELAALAQGLYAAFLACDASLVEINPLAVTAQGHLVALDTKMIVDDNALERHPDLAALYALNEQDAQEREARAHGLSYIRLEGEIGCMVNGAGLAMATMDLIKLHGSAPANFLDIGGGARAERVTAALRLILSDTNVRAVLINIFGGITRCDEVARGLLVAFAELQPRVPIVARLVGTNEEEGRRILAQADVLQAASLSEAARLAVEAARGRKEPEA